MSSAPPSKQAASNRADPGADSAVSHRQRDPFTCHVHKFGGSSLADASRQRAVARLIDDASTRTVVVVSAMQGMTDALIALAEQALAGDDWQGAFDALLKRHLDCAEDLGLNNPDSLRSALSADFDELAALLASVRDAGAAAPSTLARIHGMGETCSSRLLHALLDQGSGRWARLDARDVLVVSHGELGAIVDWERSREQLSSWRQQNSEPNVVVTGFVASDGSGEATTLGRNGSDYSAAIFAVLHNADQLTIWTDVDGVLSADPRQVRDAVCLPSMSYQEACELAYFGARVLHPQSIAPAMQNGIPVRIRNAMNPAAAGTLISADGAAPGSADRHPVKGLSLVDQLALLELSGTGLAGVPGTAERLFAALHAAAVSVMMISQGSSEHSICCVVLARHAESARTAVTAAFQSELRSGQVAGVAITPNISVLSAVGDGMVGTPGVAARLLGGLAQARVNVRAIAQGAGERNISVALESADAQRGLRAAHSAFWLSPQTLSVGLIGPGNVGAALLRQLAQFSAQQSVRNPQQGLRLRLRALSNSRRMALSELDLEALDVAATLDAGEPLDLDRFAQQVQADHIPHAMIIDCSSSDAVAAHYPRWLAAGIHVVTPNKQAGSGSLARYQDIRSVVQGGGGQFRYEATVGAGLPVIQTLRSLLDTGDELIQIDGLLSGTLAWLFNRFDGERPFSELLLEARGMGYTEPDPRDDLSGTDVARKVVILAREAGMQLSLDDVAVENLVPEALRELPLADFLARASEIDAPLATRLQQAQQQGGKLRYLAELAADGRARVGLSIPEAGHASLHSQLTDNLIQFRTRRYPDNPLVVQGPGAGPEVTAAGVFADILAIGFGLGARP